MLLTVVCIILIRIDLLKLHLTVPRCKGSQYMNQEGSQLTPGIWPVLVGNLRQTCEGGVGVSVLVVFTGQRLVIYQ